MKRFLYGGILLAVLLSGCTAEKTESTASPSRTEAAWESESKIDMRTTTAPSTVPVPETETTLPASEEETATEPQSAEASAETSAEPVTETAVEVTTEAANETPIEAPPETVSTEEVPEVTTENTPETIPETTTEAAAETTAEQVQVPDAEERMAVLSRYTNLALANVPDSRLNIRRRPGTGEEIVGTLTHLGACELLDETVTEADGIRWRRISSGDVAEGYVCENYLLTGEEARKTALLNMPRYATVTVDKAYVRFTPDTGGGWDNRRHLLFEGEDCLLLLPDQPESGEWYHVYMTDIWKEGYISATVCRVDYRMTEAAAVDVSDARRYEMVEYAKRFLGFPYVWGGESFVTGTDCSGFVMLLYRKFFGIDLAHYSPAQAELGKEIPISEMKPGDLVFYDTMHLGRVSHVAMYIGNEQVIQAFNEDRGIIITRYDFAEPLYLKRIIGE